MMEKNGKLERAIKITGTGKSWAVAGAADTITAAIDAARGRIYSNLPSAQSILTACAQAEAEMAALKINAAERAGAEAVAQPAGPSASSYGYRQNTLKLLAVRRRDGWYLTRIYRTSVYPRAAALRGLQSMTAAQKSIAFERGTKAAAALYAKTCAAAKTDYERSTARLAARFPAQRAQAVSGSAG